MSLCVRGWIPLVAMGAAIQALAAQEPRRLAQPDSVPLELATALIASGGFTTEPQILVGMLPGWMNSRVFLPPNGRVLGSAFIGSVTVGVLAVSEQPDSAIAQFKTELAKRGWKSLPALEQTGNSGGGFRPAPAQGLVDPAPVTRLALCGGDQQMLMVNAARRSGTTTQIVYRVTPTNGYGACSTQQRPLRTDGFPVPTLVNPAEVSDFRDFGNCSSDAHGSGRSVSIRSTVSLDSLMLHYAKQMHDSGWRATSAVSIGRSWSRTDSTGRLFEARLTASMSPQDSLCRDVNLTVWEVKKP